ncbi:hypothetical protein OSTOST_21072 [Ostertagia ostertagi]
MKRTPYLYQNQQVISTGVYSPSSNVTDIYAERKDGQNDTEINVEIEDGRNVTDINVESEDDENVADINVERNDGREPFGKAAPYCTDQCKEKDCLEQCTFDEETRCDAVFCSSYNETD